MWHFCLLDMFVGIGSISWRDLSRVMSHVLTGNARNPALYALRSGQTMQQTVQSKFNPGRERYCPPSENSTKL